MFKYFVIFLLINVTSVLLLPIDEKEPVADKPAEELVVLKEPSTEAPIVISSSSSSESPVTPEHIPSPAVAVPAEGTSSRPTITYDQRQEGHYNIRADLENFVFLVVPTHSASSLNLLDLLSKSAFKKSHAKNAHKKHEIKGEGVKKIESAISHHHHYHNSKPETYHGLEQFVEGRTPYKVDISSIDTSPETQLDVLPASPLSYPSQEGRSSTGALKPIKFAFDDNTPIGSVIPIKV